METNYSQSQNIQVALAWMIQREEYLKSSKSQHCHSTKLLFILHLSCTVSSSLPTAAIALQLNYLLHCWDLGCTVSSSFISAVLCPSSFISAVLFLHLCQLFTLSLSCTVSSSLPTLAGALQLEGSTAMLGSWLYCVFISTTYCWCSLLE